MKRIEVRKELIPEFEKWVENLRSGEYKQGDGYLYDRRNGEDLFCCLGVAASCLYNKEKSVLDREGMPMSIHGHFNDDEWNNSIFSLLHSVNILSDFEEEDEDGTSYLKDDDDILSRLNDGIIEEEVAIYINDNYGTSIEPMSEHSFSEIADFIEKIYIKDSIKI